MPLLASQPRQTSLDEIGRPLYQTTFVVLDLETTGGSPKSGAGITEIGAVKVKAGEVLGEFRTFVNPGDSIPPFITALTGITNEMVCEAPHIGGVLSTFLDFCGDPAATVLVAHNAPFDLGFLKSAARTLGIDWPAFHHVDTARLARQILTREEAPNCKLQTLSALFRTSVSPNHRALDDARATVDVLHALIGRLGNLRITTLEDLRDLTFHSTPAQRKKRHLIDGIPSVPGVYIFRDRIGTPLYVGTSRNLRARVRSYFTAAEQRRRILDMLNLAESISVIPCATSLEANVRELRLINEYQPTYNRRSRRQERATWVAITDETFPRLSIVRGANSLRDDLGWLGPFSSRGQAELAIAAIYETFPIRQCSRRITSRIQEDASSCVLFDMAKCGAPCIGAQSREDYGKVVGQVRDSMRTGLTPVVATLTAKMKSLAELERFEEAAEVRDRIDAVTRGRARGVRIRSLTKVAHLVAAQATSEGGWEFICIRFGRLAGSVVSKPGFDPHPIIEALTMTAEVVTDNGKVLPSSSYEECERLLDWLETPGTRLVDIVGEWSSPRSASAQ